MIHKPVTNQLVGINPYNKKQIQQNNKCQRKQENQKYITSPGEEEKNNKNGIKKYTDTNLNQFNINRENNIKKQCLKEQEDRRQSSSAFDKNVYQQALHLNLKRESINQIQMVQKLMEENKSTNELRIRIVKNQINKDQELKSRDEKQQGDLIDTNAQADNIHQKFGILIPQKNQELQKLKNEISLCKQEINQYQKEKEKIKKFLQNVKERIHVIPDVGKMFLFRNSSFDYLEKKYVGLSIEQNVQIKINRIKMKEEEVQKLNAQNKLLIEENHTLKNQIEEKEKQIHIYDNHIKDNADLIQQLQHDIQTINSENSTLQENLQNQVSELTEQKLQIDYENQNLQKQLENINQELQNKNEEIESLRFQINSEIELKNNNFQIQNQEIEQFTINLEKQKQENEQLNNQLVNLQQEVDKQKQENEQLNNDLINIQSEVDKQKQEKEQLNNELINIQSEVDKQKQEKEQLNNELINIQSEVDRQKQENEQLNMQLNDLNLQIHNKNQNQQNLEQQNQNLQIQLTNLNEEIKIKDDKILDIQIDLDSQQSRRNNILLIVKSGNRTENVTVSLMDSISDLYLMTVSTGMHNELPHNMFLSVLSKKNKQIQSSDWKTKFYEIFIPADYHNRKPELEFRSKR